MANAGRIHTFTSQFDPGALVANTVKWASAGATGGDVLDFNVGYARFDGSPAPEDLDLGPGKVFYVNFAVGTSFSLSARTVHFVVGTASNEAFTSGVREIARGPGMVGTAAASARAAGQHVAVPLPAGVKLDQYLGVGVVSSAAISDEAGRFTAWLDLFPVQTNQFLVENFN